jgi:tRNA threonylcarbamoyladenosine biosynthesis protein TsaB
MPAIPLTMKTLAVDSSLAVGSVAALSGDRLAERALPLPGEHAKRLAGALVEVASLLGWSPGDVELLAVVRGPGSFTSLRVGVATVKAMAWATGAKLLGVSGFEVIAWRAARAGGGSTDVSTARPIEIAYDAGRGDVYAATARPEPSSPSGWSVGPAAILPAGDWFAALPRAAVVSGPGLELLAGRHDERPDLRIAPRECWTPTAAAAGAIALVRFAAGEADDIAGLVPDYLRPSYAQEKDARP